MRKKIEVHPTVDFVDRANANNSITTFVVKIDNIEPYTSVYMTLSLGWAYFGYCFILPEPFYSILNAAVLISSVNMIDNIKRYIAALIFRFIKYSDK